MLFTENETFIAFNAISKKCIVPRIITCIEKVKGSIFF